MVCPTEAASQTCPELGLGTQKRCRRRLGGAYSCCERSSFGANCSAFHASRGEVQVRLSLSLVAKPDLCCSFPRLLEGKEQPCGLGIYLYLSRGR